MTAGGGGGDGGGGHSTTGGGGGGSRGLEVVDSKLNWAFDPVQALVKLRLGLMCSSDVPEEAQYEASGDVFGEGHAAS